MRQAPRGRRIGALHFEDFPPGESLWWLKWVDYDSPGRLSATPLLRVLFVRLPDVVGVEDLPVLDATLAAVEAQQHRCLIQAGWLPVLEIGLVARKGFVVGQLGSDVMSFMFDRNSHSAVVECLRRTPSTPGNREPGHDRPSRTGSMPGLVAQSAYPLQGIDDGRLLSIRAFPADQAPHLILPCPEVFRVCYAPHGSLANALLSGPWSVTKQRIYDLDLTHGLPDGGWQVAVSGDMPPSHVAVAGNIQLNRHGLRTAERVWGQIGGVASQGCIEARLPFEWDTLVVRVACLALPGGRRPGATGACFGYRILSLRWPDSPHGPPARIVHIPLGGPAVGRTRQPSRKPGFPDPPPPSLSNAQAPEAVQDVDSAGGPGAAVEAGGPMWLNAPEVVQGEKPVSFAYEPDDDRTPPEESNLLSAGNKARGNRGAPKARTQALDLFGGEQPPATSFDKLVAMLDVMAAEGSIDAHHLVEPPQDLRAIRGAVPVWALPKPPPSSGGVWSSWCIRDFRSPLKGRIEVRRTAMVRSILCRGAAVYWIEVEGRPHLATKEAHHALVFAPVGPAHLHRVLRRLLEVIVSREGVWPAQESLRKAVQVDGHPSIGSSMLWRHVSARVALERIVAVASGTP